jgi:KDO2-lipid IV(A) lauroyltransferase
MKIIKYLLEFIIVIFLFIFFKLIGRKLSSDLGCKIAKNLGFKFKSKERTIANIKRAFPTLDTLNEQKYLEEMWCNIGRTFSEYVYLKNFRENSGHIILEGMEILDQIKSTKKPTVFISGHFANFELMAMELDRNNLNIAAIYRPLNNIFLNPLMEFWRKKYICNFQIPKKIPGKEGNGTKALLKAVHNKNNIAVMVDQAITQGTKINFFNEPAFTTSIPSQLALKYNYQIIPISIERLDKYYFKMKILNPILIDLNNDNEQTIGLKINQEIEKIIIANPGQWIWTHNRWKV